MQPLYGHTSSETAYLVDDYPYGSIARCRIRYWLEFKPHHGFRLVSQTENPRTKIWNKPKPSTYAVLGAMYLDDRGHVQWRALSGYMTATEALAFVRDFPGGHVGIIMMLARKKVEYLRLCIAGDIQLEINGKVRPWTERDRQEHERDLLVWQDAARLATAAVEARTPAVRGSAEVGAALGVG
jgi:hypothetical protein